MRLSEEEFNRLMESRASWKNNQIPLKKKKRGRISSTKVEIDGHVFASQKEAQVYKEFKQDPRISIEGLQPEFILQDEFVKAGRKYPAITYTADFLIRYMGETWVVEVKSKGTAKFSDYKIRRKMFLNRYRHMRFLEIVFDGKRRSEHVY